MTLTDVLRLPAVAAAQPSVLGGTEHLSRTISGLRVVGHLDARELLVAGEMVLLTGRALLRGPDELRRYVVDLAGQGASGVMVELGRVRVSDLLVNACARSGLPVIALQQAVPPAQLVLAVDAAVLRASRALLEVKAASHERFTELTLDDASLADLVAATAELAGGQVVLSDVVHRVLALDALGASAEDLIDRWQQQELQGDALTGTTIDEASGAVVVRVEVKRHLRGRLTMFVAAPVDPAQVAVLERGAAAVAMRLNQAGDGSVWQDVKRSLLTDLVASGPASAEAAAARAAAMGRAIRGSVMAVVVIRCDNGDVGEQVERAFAHPKADVLTGVLGPGLWGVLVMLPHAQADVIDRMADKLHLLVASAGMQASVARGGYVDDVPGIRRSYDEAVEVAAAAHEVVSYAHHRGCHTIRDVGLRGLLVALRGEPRVQAFAERMLRPLMERDRREAGDWVRTLAVYLRVGGNKSLAAIELGISRQTLYQRLARVERMLDVDIDDSEMRTSLHAAVMTIDGGRLEGPQAAPGNPGSAAVQAQWQASP